MPSQSIPIIDIGLLFDSHANPAKLKALADQWDAAFSSLGFALITGHGVDPTLSASLHTKVKEFFGCPLDAKLKYVIDTDKYEGTGGYFPLGTQAAGRTTAGHEADRPDVTESFVFRSDNDPSSLPEGWRATVLAYCEEVRRVSNALMHLSAMALHLPVDFFNEHYSNDSRITLRLAYYPALNGCETASRLSPHTDFLGFTILRPDPEVAGLEVLDPVTHEWIPVPSIPDKEAFVVNAGDLIKFWTNGKWRSNLHRVVAPNPPANSAARLSMVIFTGPNMDTVVEPLESCVCKTGGKPLYGPVTPEEYLKAKLSQLFMHE